MIITVTLNAAIDKSLSVPNFRLGRRHRTVEQTTLAGGKGVNVARNPVVLVGHSYGGVVITEAGNDPKVASLAYIAAFAPDAGGGASAAARGSGYRSAGPPRPGGPPCARRPPRRGRARRGRGAGPHADRRRPDPGAGASSPGCRS